MNFWIFVDQRPHARNRPARNPIFFSELISSVDYSPRGFCKFNKELNYSIIINSTYLYILQRSPSCGWAGLLISLLGVTEGDIAIQSQFQWRIPRKLGLVRIVGSLLIVAVEDFTYSWLIFRHRKILYWHSVLTIDCVANKCNRTECSSST